MIPINAYVTNAKIAQLWEIFLMSNDHTKKVQQGLGKKKKKKKGNNEMKKRHI
jgi:hypothetical protein